jgi:hypothetical protein
MTVLYHQILVEEGVLTRRHAVEFTGLSRPMLFAMTRAGELTYVRSQRGKSRRIPKRRLVDLLAHQVTPFANVRSLAGRALAGNCSGPRGSKVIV